MRFAYVDRKGLLDPTFGDVSIQLVPRRDRDPDLLDVKKTWNFELTDDEPTQLSVREEFPDDRELAVEAR